MDTNLVIGAIVVGAICGLISLALILRFLWRVYERGGRVDLAAAARALRQVHDPNWLDKLARFLPCAKTESKETDAPRPGA